MTTKVKLAIAALIVAAATGYMAYVGTASSWQYYLTVDECLEIAPTLTRSRVRVHGMVAPDSLDVAAGRQHAAFKLDGTTRKLPVICKGPLPDNLAEDMEVVVEGRMDESGVLKGDKVLTRCASKYESETRSASAVDTPTTAAEGRRR